MIRAGGLVDPWMDRPSGATNGAAWRRAKSRDGSVGGRGCGIGRSAPDPVRLLLGLLLVGAGCAVGQPLPLEAPGADAPRGRLLGWLPTTVVGARVTFGVRLRGVPGELEPDDLRVLLDGREVVGCLLQPEGEFRFEREHTVGQPDREFTLRCQVEGVAPGEHRLVVALRRLWPAEGVRAQGIGLEPPRADASGAQPGWWYGPQGWTGRPAPSELALADWVRVGLPPDLSLARPFLIETTGESLALAGSDLAAEVDRVAGVTPDGLVRGLPPCPDPFELDRLVDEYWAGTASGLRLGAALAAHHERKEVDDTAGSPGVLCYHRATLGPPVQVDGAGPGVARDGSPGPEPGREPPLRWAIQLARPGIPLMELPSGPSELEPVLKQLLATRRIHRALAEGEFKLLRADEATLCFLKQLPAPDGGVADLVLVAVNRGPESVRVRGVLTPALSRGPALRDGWDGRPVWLGEGQWDLELPPRSARWLVASMP